MTNTNNNQAQHMNNINGKRNKGRIVALALAGVLAIGGVGAVCVAGLSKSPGQAPAAAQTVVAKPATKAKASPKKAEPKKDAAKETESGKAAAKKAGTKNAAATAKKAEAPKQAAAKQQAMPTPAAKKAETASKQAAQPTAKLTTPPAVPQQAEAPKVQTPAANDSGLEAKVSREECIKKACAHVGAGGQAKGEAKNVTAKQVTGGGTVYYVVELDLGDVHYTVNVDAIDGNVIGADSVHAGTRMLLDETGVEIEDTATPAE